MYYIARKATFSEGKSEYVATVYSKVDLDIFDESTQVDVKKVDDVAFVDEMLVNDVIRTLAGKILTTIDAVIPQGNQNKAIKDVIKDHIGNAYTHLQGYTDPNMSRANFDGDISELTEADPSEVEALMFGEKK